MGSLGSCDECAATPPLSHCAPRHTASTAPCHTAPTAPTAPRHTAPTVHPAALPPPLTSPPPPRAQARLLAVDGAGYCATADSTNFWLSFTGRDAPAILGELWCEEVECEDHFWLSFTATVLFTVYLIWLRRKTQM
eukprot:1174830-Prymnesium_polylepis.1